MCETKLDKSVKSSEFLPVNYTICFRKDRTSHGGGVLIALKSHFVAEDVDLIDIDCEIVCAKIVLRNGSPIYVGSFYRPPSDPISSLEALEVALTTISDLCKNNTKAAVVIAGDFNAGDINWDSYSVQETSTKKSICQKVIDIFNYFGLTQLQKSPTRFETILDLFACNKPSLVKSIKNIPGLSNDHDRLAVYMDIQAKISKKPPRKIYKWGQANWDDIRIDTNIFRDTFMSDAPSRSVEENYSSIEKHLKTMLGKHIPCKMSRTRVDVPWLSPGLKRQCRRKQRLYNRAKKSGKADHKAAYIRAASPFNQLWSRPGGDISMASYRLALMRGPVSHFGVISGSRDRTMWGCHLSRKMLNFMRIAYPDARYWHPSLNLSLLRIQMTPYGTPPYLVPPTPLLTLLLLGKGASENFYLV